jgi:hypothetical protein
MKLNPKPTPPNHSEADALYRKKFCKALKRVHEFTATCLVMDEFYACGPDMPDDYVHEHDQDLVLAAHHVLELGRIFDVKLDELIKSARIA